MVWGREAYCREASEQLTDDLVYERVEDNPLGRVSTLIDEKLRELVGAGEITEENRRYLKGKNVVLGRFYLLPTIHKRVTNVAGRPVVSNCGTATEEISEFVDFHLQPVVSVLLNVIIDTTDFLMKLERLGDIPEGPLIGMMDVIGLYPHIPHEEGLKSLKEIIQEFKGEVDLTEWYVDEEDLT